MYLVQKRPSTDFRTLKLRSATILELENPRILCSSETTIREVESLTAWNVRSGITGSREWMAADFHMFFCFFNCSYLSFYFWGRLKSVPSLSSQRQCLYHMLQIGGIYYAPLFSLIKKKKRFQFSEVLEEYIFFPPIISHSTFFHPFFLRNSDTSKKHRERSSGKKAPHHRSW